MIDEIINFEKALKKSGDSKQLSKPDGLYIYVAFDDEGEIKLQIGLYPYPVKDDFIQENEHIDNCFQRNQYVNGFSNSNSRFDGFKTNASCCAYALVVTKSNYENLKTNGKWAVSIDNFFTKATKFIEKNDQDNSFKTFLLNQIHEEIQLFDEKIKKYNHSKVKVNEQINDYKTIFVFLNHPIQKYIVAWDNFNQGVTNEMDQNATNSSFIQSEDLINFNIARKPFAAHYTASFFDNYKIPREVQTYVKSFCNSLKDKSIFPKPLPIFIDKSELNKKMIKIFQGNKNKLSFEDIFERIYETEDGLEDSDLQNYYLLYAINNQGAIEIKDFEFVPSFNYKLKNFEIDSVFETHTKLPQVVNTVFDFQRTIVRELFNNCLFKKDEKKGTISINYWGEVKCKSNNDSRLVLQYRKAFYEFIYKSKKQAITSGMIKDIILSGILDTLQSEESHKYYAQEERIKTLLNIYFNINQHFDPNNTNFNKINVSMATKTKELLKYAQELVSDSEKHFEDGEEMEFAFCFGQLVYYLLSQSEANNKTHSLLLAYLQKSDFDLLKQKAKEDATKYSYKISFSNKKFNKMAGEVFGYTPTTKFSELSSFFLAGYFSKNIIY
jgi:CRISPR-associated protein Csh1